MCLQQFHDPIIVVWITFSNKFLSFHKVCYLSHTVLVLVVVAYGGPKLILMLFHKKFEACAVLEYKRRYTEEK